MSSDAVFSYVGKLLIVLSLAVFFTMGYSAYTLLPSLYGQQPRMDFNGTHIIIEGIDLKNEGMYPIKLTLEVEADGQTYSDSVALKPGEARELKFAMPVSAVEWENASMNVVFEMVPFLEARIELPKGGIVPQGGLAEGEVTVVPRSIDVRKAGDIYEIEICYCITSQLERPLSLQLTLLQDGDVVDRVTKNHSLNPGTLCDSVVLKAPPGTYILEISYDSTTYSVPVTLP